MPRALIGFFGVACGMALVFGAFHFHVVRNERSYLLIPKRHAHLGDIYADVRGWKRRNWAEHPGLAQDVVAAGHNDLIPSAGFWESIVGGPLTERPPVKRSSSRRSH